MATYFEMVDAVNDAQTDDARRYAEARLSGWIECANEHGVEWSETAANLYTAAKHGDRPMCCGVLLTANVAEERERWQRIATNAQAVTVGCTDKIDHFEVPSHIMAALALALALDEAPNVEVRGR